MNESTACPHFGGRAVQPFGKQNFQLGGCGRIIIAIEDLRSPDSPIAIAEVAAILRHCPGSLALRGGKQNQRTGVATISGPILEIAARLREAPSAVLRDRTAPAAHRLVDGDPDWIRTSDLLLRRQHIRAFASFSEVVQTSGWLRRACSVRLSPIIQFPQISLSFFFGGNSVVTGLP